MDLFTLFGRIAIDASDSKEKIDEVKESAEGLATSLGGTVTSADDASVALGENGKFSAASVWMGNVLSRITDQVYNLGKAFILSGFNYNASMETYQALFTSLLGNDPEKATKFIMDLKQFAKDTPLALQGVAANAMQMLNFGFDDSEILSELAWLGDIAQGDQSRLDSIVYAYSQVRDFGKLRAQELYQFVNAGVPVRDMLKNYLGVEQEEIVQMQEDGEITFEILRNAMKAYTEEGGIFYESMNNYMDTFTGQKEKLTDAYNEMSGAFTEPFVEVTTSEVIPNLIEQLESFTTWINDNQATITNFAESIGTLATDGFSVLTSAIKGLLEIDASALWVLEILAGTVALSTGHYGVGLGLFAAAGITEDVMWDQQAEKYREAEAENQEEYEEELRQRYIDAGMVPPDYLLGGTDNWYGPPTPEGWTPANISQDTSAVIGEIKRIVESIPGAIESGLSNTTITVDVAAGNVRLDTGAMVGVFAPQVSVALGGMMMQYGRGLAE